jgi:hypothetical protein
MTSVGTIAEAFALSFRTGDRGPYEAFLAPGCVDWHNSDKLEVPSVRPDGVDVLRQLVDDLHAVIVQCESFAGGGLIRFAILGTVRTTGRSLECHYCIVLEIDESGVRKVNSYVDPTFEAQLRPDPV